MRRGIRSERWQLAAALRAEGQTWSDVAAGLRAKWPELSPRAALRVAHRWSQKKAAAEWTRLWPEHPKEARDFSLWENWPQSGRAPSLDVLTRLARLYEVSITDLLIDIADYRHLDKYVTVTSQPLQPGHAEGRRRGVAIGTAPGIGRAFFGPGPVTVAIPLREVTNRALPVISSEDAIAAHRLRRLLESLSIETGELRIPPHGIWEPPIGDLVAICGPKSSPVVGQALATDPFLTFEPDGDRWIIRRRDTPSETFGSPMDAGNVWSDVAYLGRLTLGDRAALVVAGIHALGSAGAVDYLAHSLDELHDQVGRRRFSMVIHSDHAGEAVVKSEPLCPPMIHP